MSEPVRNTSPREPAGRTAQSGPLRDWLAAMRATGPENRPVSAGPSQPESRAPETETAHPAAEIRPAGWAPKLVVPAEAAEAQDDEISELIAENVMLKAKLRLAADRQDELQLLLVREIRELRAHVAEEIFQLEDLREERDLWKARCEALMRPLFASQPD